MKRIQIYLDDEQDRRLARLAKSTGKTKSALIREALGRYLGSDRPPGDLKRNLAKTTGALPGIRAPSRDKWDRQSSAGVDR